MVAGWYGEIRQDGRDTHAYVSEKEAGVNDFPCGAGDIPAVLLRQRSWQAGGGLQRAELGLPVLILLFESAERMCDGQWGVGEEDAAAVALLLGGRVRAWEE